MAGAKYIDYALLAAATTAGGAALGLLGVPAGWLSGGMVGVAALAAAGRAPMLPTPLRTLAILMSGVGMGSGLTPETIHTLALYPLSLALMAIALAGMVVTSFAILQRSPGFSRSTAFFSAIPGALSYVFIVAAPTGADMARVAVIQVFRLFVLMVIVPLAARFGVDTVQPVFATDPMSTTAILVALAWLCGWALERRGVASGPLYAAIVVSAFAHGFGLAPGRLAPDLQIVAQLLVGAWIGSRFIGFDWELMHRTLISALTSFVAAFAVALLFAILAARLVSAPFAETLAAFAPGGLEAMTMMAFALGLDPLFVGSHHLARFFLIGLTLPFVARWLGVDRRAASPP